VTRCEVEPIPGMRCLADADHDGPHQLIFTEAELPALVAHLARVLGDSLEARRQFRRARFWMWVAVAANLAAMTFNVVSTFTRSG
jgi:hypothetical protein